MKTLQQVRTFEIQEEFDAYVLARIKTKTAPFMDDLVNPTLVADFINKENPGIHLDPRSVGRSLTRLGCLKVVPFKAKHVTRFRHTDSVLSLPRTEWKVTNVYIVRNYASFFALGKGIDMNAIKERFSTYREIVLGTKHPSPPPMPPATPIEVPPEEHQEAMNSGRPIPPPPRIKKMG